MPFSPEQANASFVERNQPTLDQLMALIDEALQTKYIPLKPLPIEVPYILNDAIVEELRKQYKGWHISEPVRPRGDKNPSTRLTFQTEAEHQERETKRIKLEQEKLERAKAKEQPVDGALPKLPEKAPEKSSE